MALLISLHTFTRRQALNFPPFPLTCRWQAFNFPSRHCLQYLTARVSKLWQPIKGSDIAGNASLR
jgi:hypothetical protein